MSSFPIALQPPSNEHILSLVGDLEAYETNYPDELIGGTWASSLPSGWFGDASEVVIGHGDEVFKRAVAALHRWTQFDLEWTQPLSQNVPILEGRLFAFTSRQLGVWSVNVCRIVKVVDDREGDVRRFGFSYGTLDRHAVRGEERFLVTHDRSTDEVRFGIRKFSQPAHWLLWLATPVVRSIQHRFTRDALSRIAREVR
ncbi:MAG: DUF1990 domain-containing protein [Myxococcota bacterium]